MWIRVYLEHTTFVDPNWLRLTIIRNLQDQFEQYWHSLLDNASKAINYRLFKDYFGMEVYFDILGNKTDHQPMIYDPQ